MCIRDSHNPFFQKKDHGQCHDKFGSGGNPKHIRSCNRILEKTLQQETGYGKCPSEQNCRNDTGQTDFPDNLIQCGIRLMFCQHAQKIKKRHFHTSDKMCIRDRIIDGPLLFFNKIQQYFFVKLYCYIAI